MHHYFELIIITGESGAGKSHALAAFEDAGFFCIDNLPPPMIEATADLFVHEGSKVERAAVVTDVRGGEYFEELDKCLTELDSKKIPYKLLYLEASAKALLRRFKETRRPHPLAPDGDIPRGIEREKEMLSELKARADWVIDTSDLNIHQLRAHIVENVVPERTGGMIITVNSFGYKYGTPLDADLIFDIRFLPNPNYEPQLKQLTGLDQSVKDFVFNNNIASEFMDKLTPLLDFMLKMYIAEGKSNLIIGVGCTGGKHRSVALAEWLAERYRSGDYRYNVIVRHRDMGKD
jgi:UPF0042 nucleotide-binding protein